MNQTCMKDNQIQNSLHIKYKVEVKPFLPGCFAALLA